jgi:transcriptional regulator with XRE-family HTH domain
MNKQTLRHLLEKKGLRLADLAKLTGLEKSTITRWDQGRVPAERVLEVEQLTGIPRGEIRPDIYPPQENGAAA